VTKIILLLLTKF